jgi:hypothetical protein
VIAQERRPSVADIPPIDRQAEHFYNALAVGPKGVSATWSADPARVPVDADFTLTLTIRNAANPRELTRPDLRQLPALTTRFQVLDQPAAPAQPDAAEVCFAYRLRPRAVGQTEIPALKYVYYRPDFPDGHRFQTTYARAIPITVTPPVPQPTTAPPVPLDAPEEFFTLAAERPVLHPGRFGWLLPVAAVPVLVVAWVFAWRWLFPDAARVAKLRRNRAARHALQRLRAARASADPAGAAAAAVRAYLTARFGMTPAAQTPAEVLDALHALSVAGSAAVPAAGASAGGGLSILGKRFHRAEAQRPGRPRSQGADRATDYAADAESFLRACDAARFTATSDNGLSLTHEAESLLFAWEGVGE